MATEAGNASSLGRSVKLSACAGYPLFANTLPTVDLLPTIAGTSFTQFGLHKSALTERN